MDQRQRERRNKGRGTLPGTRKRRERRRQQVRKKEVKVSREREENRVKVERVGTGKGLVKTLSIVEKRRKGIIGRERGKRKAETSIVWEEERVRVGTGYRVRWASTDGEANLRERVLDLGYGHKRRHSRGEGIEVTREKTNMGRTVKAKGEKARERVRNEVCKRERRRPRSVYTGCGRTRKSRVGKKKLKPTKVRAV
jgi:hypothetical protein